MANFVLIPGAGIDPGIFTRTVIALRELGHGAIAPPLPLDVSAATPSDHARAVVKAAGGLGQAIVVGQSLGAYAAPLAAELLEADGLVLVAPMIPAPGETAGEWWENTRHGEAISGLSDRFGPMSEWGEEAMAEVFLHDVDAETIAASRRWEGAPGPGMFGEPWPLEHWPEIPTRVIAPREDRLFPLGFQRRVTRERLGIEVDEIDGGHVPMLSRPHELAARLADLT